MRIEQYGQDIEKYKDYDKKKSKRHNDELIKADTLLEYVTTHYKRNLELIEKVLDNAKMQHEMDIKKELKAFKDVDEQRSIRNILTYFEERYAKRKKNLFLNIKKRYSSSANAIYCFEYFTSL